MAGPANDCRKERTRHPRRSMFILSMFFDVYPRLQARLQPHVLTPMIEPCSSCCYTAATATSVCEILIQHGVRQLGSLSRLEECGVVLSCFRLPQCCSPTTQTTPPDTNPPRFPPVLFRPLFVWNSPELNKNPPEGVSVGLTDDDNMFNWALLIVGPPDTVSEACYRPGSAHICHRSRAR